MSGRRLEPKTIGAISLVAGALAALAALVTSLTHAPDVAGYAPMPAVLLLVAAVLLAVGIGLTRRRLSQADNTRLRVLSWWWILAGAVLIVISMWTATAILMSLADTAPDVAKRVELRVDAVKTGLTVGAGAAGLVALLLGVRRQWLGERTQAHQEYDAGEKRVTELYTKATDQLGHDKAAVRLAGLHALERVAQNNPEQRQTIVDVICAYLRMPPVLAPTEPAAPDQSKDSSTDDRQEIRRLIDPQELQVRITAQRILRNHLRWSRSDPLPPSTFWADINLDLTGAWLLKLDLSYCRMGNAGFGDVTFEGFARFDGATFGGRTVFGGAVFMGKAAWGDANYKAGFADALFIGETVFRDAVFSLRADFRAVRFEGTTLFTRTLFKSWAVFRAAIFMGETTFSDAVFDSEAVFRQAEFSDSVSFHDAAFKTTPALWEVTLRPGSTAVRRLWPADWSELVPEDPSTPLTLVHAEAPDDGPPDPDQAAAADLDDRDW